MRPGPTQLEEELHEALRGPLAVAEAERARNPEWMLMADLFSVLAWSNHALADPTQRRDALAQIDAVIAATLAIEAEQGQLAFLLPYARRQPFRDPGARSLFVDGEVALMLAARLSVAPKPAYERELRVRVEAIEASMGAGPIGSGESYPDECWTFCNTTALAALRLADPILGTNHDARIGAWLAVAKQRLVDPKTGLLVSSYAYDGRVLDGPEGSSIFMVAHNLLVLDPAFARQQYAAARQELGRSVLGFGWAREWPVSSDARLDVDSGVVVPVLDASPGSSGMALLGAAAFGDVEVRDALLRSMQLAATPTHEGGASWYRAAGRIGNAVAAYALSFGPLWEQAAGVA